MVSKAHDAQPRGNAQGEASSMLVVTAQNPYAAITKRPIGERVEEDNSGEVTHSPNECIQELADTTTKTNNQHLTNDITIVNDTFLIDMVKDNSPSVIKTDRLLNSKDKRAAHPEQ